MRRHDAASMAPFALSASWLLSTTHSSSELRSSTIEQCTVCATKIICYYFKISEEFSDTKIEKENIYAYRKFLHADLACAARIALRASASQSRSHQCTLRGLQRTASRASSQQRRSTATRAAGGALRESRRYEVRHSVPTCIYFIHKVR